MSAYDVIFIDDESSLTEIFQHYVLAKYKNWRFLTFSNSVAAYNEIVHNDLQASVWIIDMMMPGKNGAQIAGAIRSTCGSAPVVLAYTALDRQELYDHDEYRDSVDYFNQVMNKREDLTSLLSLVDIWVGNKQ